MKKYKCIIKHYENCLEKYGDCHLGVDWPNRQDAEKRYRVMLEVVKLRSGKITSLLDFGCGTSALYEHMLATPFRNTKYSGIDLSMKFIELSKKKYPSNKYYCLDILEGDGELPNFDYIVMNGVFTEKQGLSFDEMLGYFKRLMRKVFIKANIGIAFNVMSKHVDWEREELFHLPHDILCDFLVKELTRNYTIRNDYGLYEYTVYLYK